MTNRDLALRKLILLAMLTKYDDNLIGNVPSQRLIFLVKHLLSVPSFNEASAGLQSELFSILTTVLPHIKDLYGDFWHGIASLLSRYLESRTDATDIVALYSALKLHQCLLRLAGGEGNEDLEEEMAKLKPSVESSLLENLTHFDGQPVFKLLEVA